MTTPAPRRLAPEVLRQRLLVEGYAGIDIDPDTLCDFLLGVAARLGLRPYAEPVIFTAGSDLGGRPENHGFDAFMPLIDSGINAYVWGGARFVSVIIYSCAAFDEAAAVDYIASFFMMQGERAHLSF